MTIDSKDLIFKLLVNDGHYETDPRAASIWSYENDWGKRTQAVFYDGSCDIFQSPYVHEPILLWSAKEGLTEEGFDWILMYNSDPNKEGEE